MEAPTPRAARLWPAAVALLALAPFLPALLSGRTLAWGESAQLYATVRTLVVESLRRFRLPLWNPYSGTGMPLLAEMLHGPLHPFSLAAAFLCPGAGIHLLLPVQLIWAAVGAAALARALGASRWAAAAAGLAYGLSGYVISMTFFHNLLSGAAGLPWAVAGLRLAGARHRWGLAGAGAATALLALTGEVQSLVTALVLGLVLAFEAGGRAGIARALGGAAAGLLAGAIQLVPGWVAFPLTDRSWALPSWEQHQWPFSPWRLPEIIAPGFFWGREDGLSPPVYLAQGGPSGFSYPLAASVFVGAPVLLLAAAGSRGGRAARVLAAASLALLWVAFGDRLGAQQILAGVPVWGGLRYAEKLLGPFTLCAAVLAGLGIDRVREAASRALLAGAAALLALVVAAEVALRLAPDGLPGAAETVARAHLATGLVHAAAALAALSLVLLLRARGYGVRWTAPALAALLWAEAVAAAPYGYRALRVRGEAVAGPALTADPPGPRIENPFVAAPAPGDPEAAERDVLALARLGAAPYNVAQRIDNVENFTGVWPARHKRLLAELQGDFWRAFRRYAVTHVVADEPRDALGRDLVARATARGTLLPAPPGVVLAAVPHRDWASFAPGVGVVATPEEALAAVVEMYRSGDRGTVVEAPGETFGAAPGRVLSVAREPDRVQVEAEAQGDGLLVVNDAWWPGWRAWLDGKPVAIYPADALVRAVRFPPGRHRLEMRYQPPEVVLGGWLSAAGVALVAALAVFAARARRPAAG